MIEWDDKYFMSLALKEAQRAYEKDEVPIGAVIVSQQTVIAKGHNQVQLLNDITAHAEILAISSASQYLNSKYLDNCALYVTLEPCMMCAGAIKWSQFGRLIYAAEDEKNGFMQFGKNVLHPSTKIAFGVLKDEATILIHNFFKSKRKK